ncbi:MAG: geranylgeranylglycerol-phosphate geranylgeranyltransferase [Flavobacteriaceae bacterium]|nr:geranylgeranylglycerol-phosphate geranylgeranyltransferase [Flavobacteriaceae bacterium]
MLHFLNLIRWKNLTLIILAQVLIKYALFDAFNVAITLNSFGFFLLIAATVCIAAAGNIINDIYDIDTDIINKPEKLIVTKYISEQAAFNWFIALSITGVGLGFYVSNLVNKSGFASIFILVSGLLYVYANYLKRTFLIGNIVISALVGLSILIIGLFELLPAITDSNQPTQIMFFKILWDYAVFAFMINLVRELIKDIEDIDGDYNQDMKTLPIIIGRERAIKTVFVISLIPLFAVTYYVVTYLYKQQIAIIYFLACIIAPLLYVTINLFSATTKKELAHLSNILKLILFFGVLSLLLYPFILK